MLQSAPVYAYIPARDVARARRFCETEAWVQTWPRTGWRCRVAKATHHGDHSGRVTSSRSAYELKTPGSPAGIAMALGALAWSGAQRWHNAHRREVLPSLIPHSN